METKNAEPISFYQLFQKEFNVEDGKITKINSVVIPIIQRDYAQGRKNPSVDKIRDSFLSALYSALCDGKLIKLDFVYGDIKNGELIPLDGQQRLTTLFLLHWYIAVKEKREDYDFLSKFSYKTRFSSRDFCKSLTNHIPDFNKEDIVISEDIQDQNWFVSSWVNDPTILSMLVMLDAIHEKFKNAENNLWDKLIDEQNPAISFYFLPIKEMGLTDSLYIKMNSRGKPLTPFEHFKANFEKIISEVDKGLYDEFIKKIDNDWTNILWKYRGDNNIIDDEFMCYYRFITESIWYKEGNEGEIELDDFRLSEIVYGKENEKAKENLRYLFDSLDCWKNEPAEGSNGDEIELFFTSIFSTNAYEKDKVTIYSDPDKLNLFLQCCNDYGEKEGRRRKFTLNSTLLLYAILTYRLNKETISLEDFPIRLRIIRNLVFNSADEIRESNMEGLLKDVEDIIIKGEINERRGFSTNQKNEEIAKIDWRIRISNSNYIEVLNELEDHRLLQGTVRIINYNDEVNLTTKRDRFFEIFNGKPDYLKISRVLLTFGDYSQTNKQLAMFGNNNDSTWRELFSYSTQRDDFDNTKECLEKLLEINDPQDADTFDEIINDHLVDCENKELLDWRYYYIKYPSMRAGASGVYSLKNNGGIKGYGMLMMNTPTSLSGRHWQPFHYVLFKKYPQQFELDDFDCSPLQYSDRTITCMSDKWEIKDINGSVEIISINQDGSGVDTEDRIIKLCGFLGLEVNDVDICD